MKRPKPTLMCGLTIHFFSLSTLKQVLLCIYLLFFLVVFLRARGLFNVSTTFFLVHTVNTYHPWIVAFFLLPRVILL